MDFVDEVLAVVPARAGSKGIRRKNLRRLLGRTLIDYACDVGKRCPSVAAVVISSDDDEMGEEGLRTGADLFVRRPAELASDDAGSAATWHHAWLEAEHRLGRQFDTSVLLQPTSPTRTVEDVEATIQELIRSGASACVTVTPVPKHFSPSKLLKLSESGTIEPVLPGGPPNRRRQTAMDAYWLNGHCYAVRRDSFLQDRTAIPADARALIIDRSVANIDEPADLIEAERILLATSDSRPTT